MEFVVLLLSLAVTGIVYGIPQIVFLAFRKSPLTLKQLKIFSISFTVAIFIGFEILYLIAYDGATAKSTAAVLWGLLFYYILKKQFTKKGLLMGGNAPRSTLNNSEVPSSASQRVKLLAKCIDDNTLKIVAQNVTCIHYRLEDDVIRYGFSPTQHLYATALADCLSYLTDGSISERDLRTAASTAEIGTIGFFPYVKEFDSHSLHGESVIYPIYTMVAQIEVLILTHAFSSDELSIGFRDIMDFVISKKNLIINTVSKTYLQERSCPIYNDIDTLITKLFSNPAFKEKILAFDS